VKTTKQPPPKPPPFKVGQVIEFIGDGRDSGCLCDDGTILHRPGRRATIVEERPGRQGTGRLVDLHDGDESFVDETRDGCNVVQFDVSFGWSTGKDGERVPTTRRCLFREDAADWKVVK
jgi:hypothetical protein